MESAIAGRGYGLRRDADDGALRRVGFCVWSRSRSIRPAVRGLLGVNVTRTRAPHAGQSMSVSSSNSSRATLEFRQRRHRLTRGIYAVPARSVSASTSNAETAHWPGGRNLGRQIRLWQVEAGQKHGRGKPAGNSHKLSRDPVAKDKIAAAVGVDHKTLLTDGHRVVPHSPPVTAGGHLPSRASCSRTAAINANVAAISCSERPSQRRTLSISASDMPANGSRALGSESLIGGD